MMVKIIGGENYEQRKDPMDRRRTDAYPVVCRAVLFCDRRAGRGHPRGDGSAVDEKEEGA